MLDDIATALETDPAALSGELDRLDAKAALRSGPGCLRRCPYNQLDRMRQTADDTVLNLTKS